MYLPPNPRKQGVVNDSDVQVRFVAKRVVPLLRSYAETKLGGTGYDYVYWMYLEVVGDRLAKLIVGRVLWQNVAGGKDDRRPKYLPWFAC